MPQFTSGGFRLAYDRFGPDDARRTLVLIHGFASNRVENWKRMGWYDAVAGKRLGGLAFDGRGHGESDKPHDPAAYDRAAMAADVVALLDAHDLRRAHVLGFSMGAHVALTLALTAPDRIDHLVVAGVGGAMFEPREEGAMARAMEAASPDEIADPMWRSFRHFADEQKEDRLALAACARGARTELTRQTLGGIGVPTLVVAGARDQLAGSPQVLASCIQGARAVTLPGCDHFSCIGHPLLKASVFDFFDGWLE